MYVRPEEHGMTAAELIAYNDRHVGMNTTTFEEQRRGVHVVTEEDADAFKDSLRGVVGHWGERRQTDEGQRGRGWEWRIAGYREWDLMGPHGEWRGAKARR